MLTSLRVTVQEQQPQPPRLRVPRALGFLPFEVQAGLASLYAAVALGVTKIPRPGNDRFPDRFLEYLPPSAKLHLV